MIRIEENYSLLPHNTFGIDLKADYFIEYSSVEELIELLNYDLLKDKEILHIGSGSNLLFLSDFNGVILHSEIKFIRVVDETDENVIVEVGGGVVWDDFVAHCVRKAWYGTENLSLIPGETGASAIQNIGAYGSEVKDIIETVHTIEYETKKERVFSNQDCEYAYRSSIFKQQLKGKYIVCSVKFRLNKKAVYRLDYQDLEEQVREKGEISLANIRKTIIEIREAKLPDPEIEGNAGSFFMNPIVPKSQLEKMLQHYPTMPHHFVSESLEKLSAAWLIDQCGWKGKQIGNAGVHDKQALVLVNKGNAQSKEILALAEQIQLSVFEKFGVRLTPEVNYIGTV